MKRAFLDRKNTIIASSGNHVQCQFLLTVASFILIKLASRKLLVAATSNETKLIPAIFVKVTSNPINTISSYTG